MAKGLEDLLPLLSSLSRDRTRRWSLAELAAEAGHSPGHFQRAFARIMGESAKQYTLRLQLEVAAVRLMVGNESVLRVALDVGFESHEGFTRAFSRHFGVSPTVFRRRQQSSDLTQRLRQGHFIEHFGPCIGLFRASLAPAQRSWTTRNPTIMSYDITKQPIEETTFLYKQARCAHTEISDTLGQLLPAAFAYATKAGIAMMGPPMTLYVEWGPGMTTIRGGMPVAPGTTAGEDLQVEVLAAGLAVATVHSGPYDSLGQAHAALEQYIDAEGLRSAGSIREIYLTDPGEVPDPADWKTRVLWPVDDIGA